jgi:hypothetical protein
VTPVQMREFIHSEIQFEHQLISNRMTWYVTSQSFLMTAFAVSGGTGNRFQWLSKWFLPGLGILISSVILFSLLAAFRSMERLRGEEQRLVESDEVFKSLRFWNDKDQEKMHSSGLLPPKVLPALFIGSWIILWISA